MKLQKILRISLILTLSACAGNPPKMERKIKLWNGTPERSAMCRTAVTKAVAFARKHLKQDASKSYAGQVVRAALVDDAVECIKSDDSKFAAFVGLTADDLGVLLRYQENLLYQCAEWKQ